MNITFSLKAKHKTNDRDLVDDYAAYDVTNVTSKGFTVIYHGVTLNDIREIISEECAEYYYSGHDLHIFGAKFDDSSEVEFSLFVDVDCDVTNEALRIRKEYILTDFRKFLMLNADKWLDDKIDYEGIEDVIDLNTISIFDYGVEYV